MNKKTKRYFLLALIAIVPLSIIAVSSSVMAACSISIGVRCESSYGKYETFEGAASISNSESREVNFSMTITLKDPSRHTLATDSHGGYLGPGQYNEYILKIAPPSGGWLPGTYEFCNQVVATGINGCIYINSICKGFTGPPVDQPDLGITDVWEENGTIYYKIKNMADQAAGESYTSLTVDGVLITSDSVASIDPSVEVTETFDYSWECTDINDSIKVCADHTNAVTEYDESNNCRTVRLTCDQPDLGITGVWEENGTIYYKIKNMGGQAAGESYTSLTVDGVLMTSDSVASIDPSVEVTETFDYSWECTDINDSIEVCADHTNAVTEYDESNNCRTVRLTCSPNIWISPALFNIKLLPDVVSNHILTIGNSGNSVLEFNITNEFMQSGWPKTTGGPVSSSPALGDIDGDGDIEVVVGSDDGKVYAWHHDSSPVTGWPKTTGGGVHSSPALGDIDGDGDIEVVVGSRDDKVYAWHHDGSAVTGWPKTTGGSVYPSPALGDIDGDGDIEVVVGSNDKKVYAWHHDGSAVTGWPKIIGNFVESSPALGDIDGDGDIEVVVGSDDRKVYAWDCFGTYDSNNIEWGMFHHDINHTGLYGYVSPGTGGTGSQTALKEEVDWLSEDPTNGAVDPGTQAIITVTLDTTSLDFGDYYADIIITSNDPDENPLIIPAHLTVGHIDIGGFAADFGRADCIGDCPGDSDGDEDVDGSDLAEFAKNLGLQNP